MDVLDLLVVGGGITGAGVARLAARNGLGVALVERGDLASGASSGSSHMLHGGLRYLEHGHLHMVREALLERAAVVRMAGPLARPARFVVPCYAGARVGQWRLRAGLALYDLLGGGRGFAPHEWIGAREVLALQPDLEPRGLLGAGVYSDAVMDDARLVVAVARDAAVHGARILPHREMVETRGGGGALEVVTRGRPGGAEEVLRARCVVLAAGPWTDEARARVRPAASAPARRPMLRPSRGVHLVYPALTRGTGLLLLAARDGRVFFAVPFGDRTLVGTTEVEVPSPLPEGGTAASVDEVRYLRAELARALPDAGRARPLTAYSGVRPLLRSSGRLGAAPREHRVVEEGPVVIVAGGKYTTFRVMARDVLRAAMRRLGRAREPLRDPVEPLPPPCGDLGPPDALGSFAAREEFALGLEDAMRRRTRLWLEPDGGLAAAAPVAAAMAGALGWSAERQRQELASWEAAVRSVAALIAEGDA